MLAPLAWPKSLLPDPTSPSPTPLRTRPLRPRPALCKSSCGAPPRLCPFSRQPSIHRILFILHPSRPADQSAVHLRSPSPSDLFFFFCLSSYPRRPGDCDQPSTSSLPSHHVDSSGPPLNLLSAPPSASPCAAAAATTQPPLTTRPSTTVRLALPEHCTPKPALRRLGRSRPPPIGLRSPAARLRQAASRLCKRPLLRPRPRPRKYTRHSPVPGLRPFRSGRSRRAATTARPLHPCSGRGVVYGQCPVMPGLPIPATTLPAHKLTLGRQHSADASHSHCDGPKPLHPRARPCKPPKFRSTLARHPKQSPAYQKRPTSAPVRLSQSLSPGSDHPLAPVSTLTPLQLGPWPSLALLVHPPPSWSARSRRIHCRAVPPAPTLLFHSGSLCLGRGARQPSRLRWPPGLSRFGSSPPPTYRPSPAISSPARPISLQQHVFRCASTPVIRMSNVAFWHALAQPRYALPSKNST